MPHSPKGQARPPQAQPEARRQGARKSHGLGRGMMSQGRGAAPGTSGATPRQYVRVADAAARWKRTQVELGVSTAMQAQVLSGLAEGERVVSGLVVGNGAGRPG